MDKDKKGYITKKEFEIIHKDVFDCPIEKEHFLGIESVIKHLKTQEILEKINETQNKLYNNPNKFKPKEEKTTNFQNQNQEYSLITTNSMLDPINIQNIRTNDIKLLENQYSLIFDEESGGRLSLSAFVLLNLASIYLEESQINPDHCVENSPEQIAAKLGGTIEEE